MTNDEKDRHVVAAAVHSEAAIILTLNLRHFRPEHLVTWGVRALHPQSFLIEIFQQDQAVVLTKLDQQATDVRAGGPGYQKGGPLFANRSPRLSLFSDPLRTVRAVKGSLRRAQQRRALDRSGPFRTTLLRRGKGSLRTAPLTGDHFAAILVPFFAATDTQQEPCSMTVGDLCRAAIQTALRGAVAPSQAAT